MTAAQASRLREQLLATLAHLHEQFDFFDGDDRFFAQSARAMYEAETEEEALALLDEFAEVLSSYEPDDDDDPEEDDPYGDDEDDEDDMEENPAMPIAGDRMVAMVVGVAGALAPAAIEYVRRRYPAGPVLVNQPPSPHPPSPEYPIRDVPFDPPAPADPSEQKGAPAPDETVIDIKDFRPVDSE